MPQDLRIVEPLHRRGSGSSCSGQGSWADVHITVKEDLPIVMGTARWGQWQYRSVKCRCDNAEVVAIIRSGSSREERAMHLMRCYWSKIQLNPAGRTFTREM